MIKPHAVLETQIQLAGYEDLVKQVDTGVNPAAYKRQHGRCMCRELMPGILSLQCGSTNNTLNTKCAGWLAQQT